MTWEGGAIIVAIICALLSYPILLIRHYGVRIVAILITPYLVAQALYWGEALTHARSGETASWAGLFVGVWFLAGLPALLVGLVVSSRIYRATRHG